LWAKTPAAICVILLTTGFLATIHVFKPTHAASLDPETRCRGTVDKSPGESFNVEITFKNKGSTEGTWEVTAAFEGDFWIWDGYEKLLTLDAGEKKTLEWEGNVPGDASADSVARLILYYDNEFKALDWWIHVEFEAELRIIDSKVT
jgi:hypothetical protein